MKKIIASISTTLLASLVAVNCYAAPLLLAYDGAVHEYSGEIYSLVINGEPLNPKVPPIVMDDRTLVPARAVFEKLGAKLDWDGINEKVLVRLNSSSVELKINDRNAKVDNKVVQMDVPAKIINDSTMIPARFVAEQLNMKVDWNQSGNQITIDKSKLNNITCNTSSSQDTVTIFLDYYKNYRILRFDPARIVIDFPNVSAPESPKKQDVNGNSVKSIRYAQFDDPTTGFKAARVVLDVDPSVQYQVEEKQGQLVVYAKKDTGLPDRGEVDRQPTTAPTVTPEPTQVPTPAPTITPAPTVEPTVTPAPTVGPIVTPTPTVGPIVTPTPTPSQSPGPVRGLVDLSTIQFTKSSGQETVAIKLDNYSGYRAVRVTDTDRIVIDIPNTAAPAKEQKLNVDSGLIKSIRCAQFENNTARIVIDMNGQTPYDVEEKNGQLILKLTPATYKNIVYHSNGDRVYVTFPGIALAESASVATKKFKESYEAEGRKYIMTFPSTLADIGTGIMRVNDSFLDSIEIKQDAAAGNTSIIFNGKSPLSYETVTRYNYNNDRLIDTAVTLFKPATKADKLVVIDPGHGGFELGAVSGDLLEKNLNLDISVRLNNLLKSKGVKTYMIRQDDSYVDLYERAYLANRMNAALFVCVHNNSFNGVAVGTETLYYPQDSSYTGFSNKRFAQIVQEKLVKALGTQNRGIVERPALVVLKKTTMPAILAEVGFMDNAEEKAKLNNPEFRQKAAEALCDAVIQSLGEIK